MSKVLGLDLVSKRQRKLSDYIYRQDYRNRWNDNDMFHHVNNPVYAVLIDSIINSYLIEKSGYSPLSSAQIGLVANTYCDYFGSAQYPGVMDTGLRVVRLGKTSVVYEVGMFQDGALKAVGGFTQIWVDRATNRPLKDGIPQHVKKDLEVLLKGSEQDPAAAKSRL